MRGEIIQHERRRQDQPPRERQGARGRARTPAARLIADRQPLDLDAELLGAGLHRFLQIGAHFALHVIVHPPLDMLGAAGDAENALTAVARFRPHRAAHAGTMHDPVRNAAQRDNGARLKRCGLRQPAETRGDPGAMALRKILGVGERAARRHGQDRFAVAGMNAQGIAPRAPMPAQPDRIDLRAVLDQESGRLGGPPVKESASGHVCKSGDQEFARILP